MQTSDFFNPSKIFENITILGTNQGPVKRLQLSHIYYLSLLQKTVSRLMIGVIKKALKDLRKVTAT